MAQSEKALIVQNKSLSNAILVVATSKTNVSILSSDSNNACFLLLAVKHTHHFDQQTPIKHSLSQTECVELWLYFKTLESWAANIAGF